MSDQSTSPSGTDNPTPPVDRRPRAPESSEYMLRWTKAKRRTGLPAEPPIGEIQEDAGISLCWTLDVVRLPDVAQLDAAAESLERIGGWWFPNVYQGVLAMSCLFYPPFNEPERHDSLLPRVVKRLVELRARALACCADLGDRLKATDAVPEPHSKERRARELLDFVPNPVLVKRDAGATGEIRPASPSAPPPELAIHAAYELKLLGEQFMHAPERADVVEWEPGGTASARPADAADREHAALDAYVTLSQAAALAGKGKRTLERWLSQEKIPVADVVGGEGHASTWRWSALRPALEPLIDRPLPERFPAGRIV